VSKKHCNIISWYYCL